MKSSDIANWRLQQQRLSAAPSGQPADVVGWLGAVQSQEYADAKWSLGLRLPTAQEHEIEEAFTAGTLLRTHVMRPTWHFVTPADIRWLLALTASRIHTTNAYYYRKAELDDALLARSDAVLAAALQGGKQLTRVELKSALQQAGITMGSTDATLRLSLIVMHAELERIICSGARRGKQFTYALLDERVAPTSPRERDDALAELTRRYFTSHGPATVKDFVWWSGLTVANAQTGLHLVQPQLCHEMIDGQTYWFADATTIPQTPSTVAYLLPTYDEFTIGYTNYSAICDPTAAHYQTLRFFHTIIIDGRVVGTWKRVITPGKALVTTTLFAPLTSVEELALAAAAERYGAFLGMPAILA